MARRHRARQFRHVLARNTLTLLASVYGTARAQGTAMTQPRCIVPGMTVMNEDALRSAVAQQLADVEAAAMANVRTRGSSFLGRERVSRCSPFKCPAIPKSKRQLKPTFAVGKGQQQALVAALTAWRAFQGLYREALVRWREGTRTVLFPAGTWLMPRFHGAGVVPTVGP